MKFFHIAAALAGLAGLASAHMEMSDPPPFRSKFNKNAPQSEIDYSMTAPLGIFPCKGYQSDFGTPAGASVASWPAGSQQKMTITGGAAHEGGSCQASLSYDRGATFKVIHSYIGNCPVNGASSYPFTVPKDAASGEVIFAWTWFNKVGNREMYMNCAAVTITAGSSSEAAIDALPDIFVANVAAAPGCGTSEGSDVMFPNPGAFVDNNSQKTAPPTGSCAASSGGGGGSAPAPAPAPAAPEASAPVAATSASTAPAISSAPASTPASVPASTPASTPVGPGGPGYFSSGPAASAAPAPVPAPVVPHAPSAPTAQPSIPGGVFKPQPPPASAPTTQPSAAPAPAPAPPASSPISNPGPSTGSAGTLSGPCPNEGAWNCIGGNSFQRCASGSWSSVIAMAAGTGCTTGVSMNLEEMVVAGRRLAIRGVDRFALEME